MSTIPGNSCTRSPRLLEARRWRCSCGSYFERLCVNDCSAERKGRSAAAACRCGAAHAHTHVRPRAHACFHTRSRTREHRHAYTHTARFSPVPDLRLSSSAPHTPIRNVQVLSCVHASLSTHLTSSAWWLPFTVSGNALLALTAQLLQLARELASQRAPSTHGSKALRRGPNGAPSCTRGTVGGSLWIMCEGRQSEEERPAERRAASPR